MSKVVVVGTNHAGTAAVKTILSHYGSENEVVTFDQNSNISFLAAVWPCGLVTKSQLVMVYFIQARKNSKALVLRFI